eukprot:4301718-Prymnesium_polylepis.1
MLAKGNAIDKVPEVIELLECDVLAADTLTELFKNNERLVTEVQESDLVENIIELLRTVEDKAKYVNTLCAVCELNGRAVGPNQELISKELMLNLELVPKLRLSGDGMG